MENIVQKPKVSIIILNWNGWKDTIECLESLFNIDYPDYDIVIVDNNSEDKSLMKIRDYCQNKISVTTTSSYNDSKKRPIKFFEYDYDPNQFNSTSFNDLHLKHINLILINNDQNYGFAEGNNIGIKFSLTNLDPDYILLLNNDTIVDKLFLNELIIVSTNYSDSNIILGSKILFYDYPDMIQSAGIKIKWFLGEFGSIGYRNIDKPKFNIVQEVDSLTGCSMLIGKDIFKKGIFLNSKLFLYYEDIDFCLRVKKMGGKIIYVPRSEVFHKISASTKKSGIREYYSHRNLFIIMNLYSGKKHLVIFLLYFFLFRIWLTLLIVLFYHKNYHAVKPVINGSYDGLKHLIKY